MIKPLNIVFAGTPEFAASSLNALCNNHFKVSCVYTQPDRPSGRGQQLTFSPVKQLAIANNIPVHQPTTLKNSTEEEFLRQLKPDIMVVVAYGMLLPETILNIPRLGCINVHASLLPRWRGAAPIQRAILAQDKISGISIMQMDVGLDTGPLLLQSACALTPTITTADLHDRLAQLGAQCLIEVLNHLTMRPLMAIAQEDACATYAKKINKTDAMINWHQSAQQIAAMINGFNPWPVAHSQCNEIVLRIWQAHALSYAHQMPPGHILEITQENIIVACGHDALALDVIQFPNKRPASVKELLNAYRELFTTVKQFNN